MIVQHQLQWGRARVSAEIEEGRMTSPALAFASMGPRSCERGNLTTLTKNIAIPYELQWGRARVSAEITTACLVPVASYHGFNGAALV